MPDPKHESLMADLSAYLDGELAAERAAEVARFLEQSPEARRMLAGLTAVSEGLRGLPHAAAPVGMAATMRRAAEEQAAGARPVVVRRSRILRLYVGLGAAAAVLLGGLWIGWRAFTPAVTREKLPEYETALKLDREKGMAEAPREALPPLVLTEPDSPPSAAVVPAEKDLRVESEPVLEAPVVIATAPPAVETLPSEEADAAAGANFVLIPKSDAEYTAATTLLGEWATQGAVTRVASANATEQVYLMSVADFPGRMEQLGDALGAPGTFAATVGRASAAVAPAGEAAGVASPTPAGPTAMSPAAHPKNEEAKKADATPPRAASRAPGAPRSAADERAAEREMAKRQQGPFLDKEGRLPARPDVEEKHRSALVRQGLLPATSSSPAAGGAGGVPVMVKIVLLPPTASSQPASAPSSK